VDHIEHAVGSGPLWVRLPRLMEGATALRAELELRVFMLLHDANKYC
jgi:hypothetical protein